MARPTPAGEFDKRITFQQEGSMRTGLGTREGAGWSNVGVRWAKVRFGSSSERREAGLEQASQAATFRTRMDVLTNTVTAGDRIFWRGQTYDITGVSPFDEVREIEFTGVAARAQ